MRGPAERAGGIRSGGYPCGIQLVDLDAVFGGAGIDSNAYNSEYWQMLAA